MKIFPPTQEHGPPHVHVVGDDSEVVVEIPALTERAVVRIHD